MRALLFVLTFACLPTALRSDAAPARQQSQEVVITRSSVRIDGVELRRSRTGYFSFGAARRVLGPRPAQWVAGLGVTVYAWQELGISLQRGWRGPEKGQLFKLHVWLRDNFGGPYNQHGSSFRGHLRVDGVDLQVGQSLAALRPELERAGYHLGSGGVFQNDEVAIIPADEDKDQIGYVEVLCQPET